MCPLRISSCSQVPDYSLVAVPAFPQLNSSTLGKRTRKVLPATTGSRYSCGRMPCPATSFRVGTRVFWFMRGALAGIEPLRKMQPPKGARKTCE